MSLARAVAAPVACLTASLPLLALAQSPNLVGATCLSAKFGTGKVGLTCPADTPCSRVDSNLVLRAGHRLDAAWAFEVADSHIDADWGFLGANDSAEFAGFGVGAAHHLPVSDGVTTLLRAGLASNEIKLHPAVGLGGKNAGTQSTSTAIAFNFR